MSLLYVTCYHIILYFNPSLIKNIILINLFLFSYFIKINIFKRLTVNKYFIFLKIKIFNLRGRVISYFLKEKSKCLYMNF